MASSLLTQEILRRTAKRATVRYGNVESASNGLASVRIGSTTVENATWLRDYLPSVGDRVAVLASGTGWLILDAVESAQRAYNEPETTLVKPTHEGRVTNLIWSESYDPDPDQGGSGKLPEPLTGGWSGLRAYDYDGSYRLFVETGYYYAPAGGGGLNYVPANGYNAPFLWYPRLDAQVPAEAVIQSASLVLRMWQPSPTVSDFAQPAKDAPITIYGHTQPTTTAPDGSPPEFYFDTAYPAIDGGLANPGDAVVIPLPPQYVDALIDGSLRGLSLWPGETQKRIAFEDDGTYHWVKPYPNSPGFYEKRYSTSDNLCLQVTYVMPVEEN